MTFPKRFPVRGLPVLRRLLGAEGGMAAVEFSLILPILCVLWIGGVELTQGLSVDRRLNNLVSAVGDLSARSKQLTYSDISTIFDIAPGALYPYCKTEADCTAKGLQMRITAVDVSAGGSLTIAWSRAQGTSPYDGEDNIDALIPAALRVPSSQVIMAEVNYTYQPAVGYVVTGAVALDDRMFFVPRLTQYVKLCDNDGDNCVS